MAIYKYLLPLLLMSLFLNTYIKENYVDYPNHINNAVHTTKYEDINKEILNQSNVYISKGYKKNTDMYPLDYATECDIMGVPTTYYNKN